MGDTHLLTDCKWTDAPHDSCSCKRKPDSASRYSVPTARPRQPGSDRPLLLRRHSLTVSDTRTSGKVVALLEPSASRPCESQPASGYNRAALSSLLNVGYQQLWAYRTYVCARNLCLAGDHLAGFWDHPAPKRVGRLRMRVPQSTPRGRSSSTPHGRRPHPRGPASTEPTRADGSAHEACALPHAHAIPTRSQNQYTGAQQRTTSEPTCRSTGWI